MSVLKPFRGFRPSAQQVAKIASRPYDVLDSAEARVEAAGNDLSFLHVTKPEIDLPVDIDTHSQVVYDKAKNNLQQFIQSGVFVQDAEAMYYVYGQTMFGKTQYGLVGCSGVEDYMNGIIKKHELTRPDKEEDRMNHVRSTSFNAEPVFFAYPDHAEVDSMVSATISKPAAYDFVTEDGVGHHFWVISDKKYVSRIEEIFAKDIPYVYVADGHHRTAAAALVGNERKKNNPKHTGKEEYNFFLSVNFPASQLTIIDYNRVIRDLNGLSEAQVLEKLKAGFDVADMGTEIYKPTSLHNFSMYLGGRWYSLTAHAGTYNDHDPIGVLDVTILTNLVLAPIFDIQDLRRSTRIDFVGGIRGLGELKRRVDSGEMKAAFALFPVSMKQLMDIADSGNIMPPKTTWFEPKLRSGLVLHSLD